MTPDAIARSYDTSMIVRRWLGCWVDFIALGALFLIPDALLGNATYQRLLPLWIVLAALYFPVTEGLTGRSLGKLATRTIVVNARGEKPGVGAAIVRTLLRLLEVNPLLLGGVPAGLVAVASKTRQRLGDVAAKTYVLKSEHLALLGANVQSMTAMQKLAPRERSKWAVAAGYLAGILGVRDLKQHPDRSGMAGAIFEIVMGVLGTAVIVLAVVSSHF